MVLGVVDEVGVALGKAGEDEVFLAFLVNREGPAMGAGANVEEEGLLGGVVGVVAEGLLGGVEGGDGRSAFSVASISKRRASRVAMGVEASSR